MNNKSILQKIGNTPLVKLSMDVPCSVYAKLEYLNPSGSIKDRSALYLIEQAEQEGTLKPGDTIIDASSGNHGISVAMIGAVKGYKVIISASEKISQEKLQTMRAYGAEVYLSPPTSFIDDPKSYHTKARELHKSIPGSFFPNQYFNPVNAQAHYASLGPELWDQTEGSITHYLAAAGTGGHISGAGQYLKEKNSDIKVCAVDAKNSWRSTKGNPKPYKLEGIGIDFESPVLNKAIIDEYLEVEDESAIVMLKVLARKHGILAGTTAGAVAHAAYEYAKNLSASDVLVMVFSDSGRAYLTKNFY